VIDFNTLTQHEISHILFGKDSEYQAQYVEAAYREFLTGLAKNGYAQNGSGITDYDASMLTVQEIARLNGYTDEEMQKFINGFMEGLIGKKNWRNFKNGVQANVKRVPIVGAATSKILTKVSQVDRKIKDREGKNIGIGVRKKKISIKHPIKSAKYIKKSFTVTKKENRNKGTTKVIKAAKQYEKFDNELDADEKDNVLDNIINQNAKKGGTSYTENLFTVKRITDFINNPTRKATLIENDKEEGLANRITAISKGIYKDIWNAVDSGKKEVEIGKTIFEIYNRTSLDSGMDAMTLINKNTGETRIIYQGSKPGLPERALDPENWDKDWSNNLYGNTPTLANIMFGIGNAKNSAASTIKGIGDSIVSKSIIKTSEYNQFSNSIFGNYITLPTMGIGEKTTSFGQEIKDEPYSSLALKTEYYKSNEKGTPKQYIDGYNYSVQMEKELQKRFHNPNLRVKSHDGHSLAGGIAIYVGSRRNTEVIAVDPAPVNNPGSYINNNRMLTVVPDHGNALLNQTIRINGRDTSRFSPGTGMIKNAPIPKFIKNGLSSIIPSVIGVGKGANGKLAVYDNIGAEPGSFGHEPNYEELKQKNDKEMDSFMMPKGAVK
jgi:putative uncharacterized protein (fragment)